MRKYLLHVLIISFIFLLAPTTHVALYAGWFNSVCDNYEDFINRGINARDNGLEREQAKESIRLYFAKKKSEGADPLGLRFRKDLIEMSLAPVYLTGLTFKGKTARRVSQSTIDRLVKSCNDGSFDKMFDGGLVDSSEFSLDLNDLVLNEYPNGQKKSERNWKDGKPDGKSTKWYENGQKKSERNYKYGYLDGKYTKWYENGQIKEKRNYKLNKNYPDGYLDGKYAEWYENGQKKRELEYRNGNWDGIVALWHENGQKQEASLYKDGDHAGSIVYKYYDSGQIKDRTHRTKDGKLHGVHIGWHENGQKKDEGNFKDGKLDGKYTEWYENGQIKLVIKLDKEANCEDGKYIEAILSFKQAIWIDPDDADAHYNLGNAYGESGRYEGAIEPYKQVLRINPDYRNAHYNLGVAYSMLGKHKEAIESFKQANPYSADTHYNLGVVYGELGRYEEAIESYKQVIGIVNYHGDAHYNLGVVYDKLGRREEALESHKQAVKMKSRDADALYNLACCYSFFGNVKKALEWLDRAIIFGFDDIKHIENDSDWNGLRDEAGYKRLINKLKGETLINVAIGQDSKANLGSTNMEGGSEIKNAVGFSIATSQASTNVALGKEAKANLGSTNMEGGSESKDGIAVNMPMGQALTNVALGEDAKANLGSVDMENRLLVMPLKALSGIKSDEAIMLTDVLSIEMHKSGKFTILNRNDMKAILDEKEFEVAMGCDDNVCLLENVEKLAVNKIITGNIGKLGARFMITVRMINEDGENEVMAKESCTCPIEDLEKTMERVSYKFLSYLTGEEISAPESVVIREEPSHVSGSITKLRSSYKTLSVSQVHSMPNVSIREKTDWGFFGHSTINHDYNLKTIGGDKVAVDNATGQMWHQSGSDYAMHWDDAKEWVEDLNSEGYAGYQDWRLPTVEEAASLLESSKKNDFYIDSIFSCKQQWIWTGNEVDGSEAAWHVRFGHGSVGRHDVNYNIFVRPVRFGASITKLRSSYKTLSVSQVHSMPNVSIREKKDWGFFGHSTINHDYNLKTIGGDKVAVDNATGQMWHQSGSDGQMHWDDAKEWVEDLNSEGYAGYQDWRLPTVDEAASLLEPSKRIGRYIDPVFDKKQQWIWTGNEVDGSEAAWSVYFGNGHVYRSYFIDIHSVRPVRSVE